MTLNSTRYIKDFLTIYKLLSSSTETLMHLFYGMKLEFKSKESVCCYLLLHLCLKFDFATKQNY